MGNQIKYGAGYILGIGLLVLHPFTKDCAWLMVRASKLSDFSALARWRTNALTYRTWRIFCRKSPVFLRWQFDMNFPPNKHLFNAYYFSLCLVWVHSLCESDFSLTLDSFLQAKEESSGAPRMLKISLTDGSTTCHAVEISKCDKLSLSTPPGSKIRCV
jgi:hypothetical protein